jgi:glycosyltransferase involved in cell wall biosynthesis
MGHDVTLLTIRQDDSLPHIEQREGYTVIRFNSFCSPLGNDISLGLAQYLQKANEFDVIHAHSHLYFATNLAALKRQFGQTPLAITNHGLFSQNAPEWMFDIYLRTLGRWTLNRADQIFCYTEEDKRRVRELGVRSPIAVVSNGVDTERFTADGVGSTLVDADGPVVLFVGRFVEGKRPQLAVEAFAEVMESKPDAELYLCGEGSLREELEQRAAELGIRDSVTFLGHVPYKKMPSVYRSADVLVLPSRAEGVPRTIVEALSSGVPVVSSGLPQVRSAFGETVAYAKSGDSTAFSDQICDELEQSAVSILDSTFQWERTVEKTTSNLESVV